MNRERLVIAFFTCLLLLSIQTINAQSPCTEGLPYRNCPACGTARSFPVQKLDVLKNRSQKAKHTHKITVAEMRDPSNNKKFNFDMQVEVTGFVASVQAGGYKESCNCGREDLRDIHINIVADPKEVGDQRKYVIVEFTPRWQEQFGLNNHDYQKMLQTVKEQIAGKWVKFEGWMMFDYFHEDQSESTRPGNESNWRATAWEVHPVTSYTVLTEPPHSNHR
jgi:hypothetical protein